jgi:hypothetical protein
MNKAPVTVPTAVFWTVSKSSKSMAPGIELVVAPISQEVRVTGREVKAYYFPAGCFNQLPHSWFSVLGCSKEGFGIIMAEPPTRYQSDHTFLPYLFLMPSTEYNGYSSHNSGAQLAARKSFSLF